MSINDLWRDHAADLTAALDGLRDQLDMVEATAQAMAASLRGGGRLFMAGNGGSAAEAQHFSAEFVGRLRPDRNREPLPAIALHAETSSLTALANDYGYDEVFARQVRAFCKPEDAFIALSTSGSSANLVRAVEDASAIGTTTIGLVGGTERALHRMCDHVIAVPSTSIPAIQEAHLVLVHVLTERVEDLLGVVPSAGAGT